MYKKKIKFACPHCGRPFQKERQVKQHIKDVHKPKEVSCVDNRKPTVEIQL